MIWQKRYLKITRIFLGLCFLLLSQGKLLAQGQGNVWAFGKYAGIDFNSGSPVPLQTAMDGYGEGCASIANSAGQLLFYTEGTRIWDRNGNMMPNGNSLTGLPYILNLHSPTSSTTQGVVIVPMPDSLGKYYVFSLSSQPLEMGVHAGKLYYSVVDMTLNGGMGDVVPGRKGILFDSLLTEKMIAVQGDRCNIWLLVHGMNNAIFKAYEITSAGIGPNPVISNTGATSFLYTCGTMKISPNRKKLACANVQQILFTGIGNLELFDFDPFTGIVSNGMTIDAQAAYGACFSPDNSKLYVSRYNTSTLYQYDVTLPGATAISNSKVLVGQGGFTDLKLGPDGKIYLSGTNNPLPVTHLSAINFPDNAGLACQFTQDVVTLLPGTSFFAGLPNDLPLFVRDTVATGRSIKVCFQDSIRLVADSLAAGWDYVWSAGETGRIITVDSSADYIVTYRTPPCIFHRDTFRVFFASPVPLTGAFPGCKEQGNGYLWVQPKAGDTVTYGYTWKDSAGATVRTSISKHGDTLYTTVSGKYSVTMSGMNGCDTTLELRLSIPDYQASFKADSIICIGDTLILTNTSTGFSSYLWDFGNGDTSTAASPRYVFPRPGVYMIALVGNPCNDSATMTVTVDSTSYIRFVTDEGPFCEGTAIHFQPFYPAGADTIRWDFGDDTHTLESLLPAHAYDTPGVWIVKVTASFRACADTSFADTIAVHPYPRVDIGADTSLCANATPLLLSDRIAHPASYAYRWITGDSARALYVRHPGIYSLTVTSDMGCSTTDSVTVLKSCYLDIPNAFTPNGDGINDYFFPRQLLSRELTRFRMQVFNRWGQVIFETDRLDGRGWDGKFNSRDQPAGVYIYLIEADIAGNITENYKGNVTLIR